MADSIASLVKYGSAATALEILRSGTLRFSAPALFDDPFELSHRTPSQFSADRLLEALLRQVTVMLFGPETPPRPGSRLLITIRRWREEQRFSSEEEARRVLHGLLGQLAQAQARLAENHWSEWQRYASRVRLACFSARHDILPCWERYACQHRGVALRFAAGDGHLLARPQRLRYSRQAQEIVDIQQQLDILFYEQLLPSSDEFQEKLLVKGRHLLQEAEWRCLFMAEDQVAMAEDQFAPADEALSHGEIPHRRPLPQEFPFEARPGDKSIADPLSPLASDQTDAADSQWHIDREIPAEDLQSVYFGLRISEADKARLLDVLQHRFPAARLFQAIPQSGRFGLEFVPLATL